MECSQDLTVFSYDLRGKLAVRILKFLKRRYVGKGPDEANQRDYQYNRYVEKQPEPFQYLFLCFFLHVSLKIFRQGHL